MSLTRRLAFNTSIQLLGKIISTLLGLVAIALLTRYLGPEKFGWYTTAVTFLTFAGILVDFGLIPMTAQMLGEGKYREETLVPNLLGYRLTTAGIFFLIAPLIAMFFPYPTEVKIAIWLMAASFIGNAINQVLVGYYQYRLKMQTMVLAENLGRVALVISLWLLTQYGSGFLPLMAAVTGGSLVYTAVLWWQATRDTSAGVAYNPAIWRAITKKMWPIAISIVFNVVYLKGDTLLLTFYRSQVEVGWYGAAYRVIDILAQLAMMLMGVMLPLLAAAWATRDTRTFTLRLQHSFDILMLVGIPITFGTALLAPRILEFVAGPAFQPAGPILSLLAFAVLGVFVGAVFGHTAVAINQQKATMWIYISNAVITLVGYLWAIPRYGLWGAASWTVFSEWYAGILLAIVISRHLTVRLSLKTFFKILFAGLVMSWVVWWTLTWPLLLVILLAIVAYVGALYAVGGISRATIAEILRKS